MKTTSRVAMGSLVLTVFACSVAVVSPKAWAESTWACTATCFTLSGDTAFALGTMTAENPRSAFDAYRALTYKCKSRANRAEVELVKSAHFFDSKKETQECALG